MVRNKFLTEQDRAVLAGLDSVGVSSISALAEASNLKAHAVRYRLQNLLEQDLLSPFCSIDPAAIGFSSYIVYFSLSSASPADTAEALNTLVSHQNVSWVGELSGSFQYGCTICARDATHAMSLLGQIIVAMGIEWQRKHITQRTHLVFWPLKFFSADTESSVSIAYPTKPARHEIDELDHLILRHKGENATLSHSEIGRSAGIAPSTIAYRIEQLIEKKIILGSWYAPNWGNLGMGHSEVSLIFREISPSLFDELILFGRRTRSCMYVVGGLGSWDFQFNILSSHPAEPQRFISELWEKFGNKIEDLSISGYTGLLKYRTYPFHELHGAH
jgi:DNA-binding Lrp family transcriptional regulator